MKSILLAVMLLFAPLFAHAADRQEAVPADEQNYSSEEPSTDGLAPELLVCSGAAVCYCRDSRHGNHATCAAPSRTCSSASDFQARCCAIWHDRCSAGGTCPNFNRPGWDLGDRC